MDDNRFFPPFFFLCCTRGKESREMRGKASQTDQKEGKKNYYNYDNDYCSITTTPGQREQLEEKKSEASGEKLLDFPQDLVIKQQQDEKKKKKKKKKRRQTTTMTMRRREKRLWEWPCSSENDVCLVLYYKDSNGIERKERNRNRVTTKRTEAKLERVLMATSYYGTSPFLLLLMLLLLFTLMAHSADWTN